MTNINHTYLIVIFLLLLSNIVVSKEIAIDRSGSVDEYLKVEYAIQCKTKSDNVTLLLRYTNISNKLIGFDSGVLGLTKNVLNLLYLVPVDKKDIFDQRGFRIGVSGISLNRPSDNDLIYSLNIGKTFYVRFPVSQNYFIDFNSSYNATYYFTFEVRSTGAFWHGSFKFLFDYKCLKNRKLVWHKVNKTEGYYTTIVEDNKLPRTKKKRIYKK